MVRLGEGLGVRSYICKSAAQIKVDGHIPAIAGTSKSNMYNLRTSSQRAPIAAAQGAGLRDLGDRVSSLSHSRVANISHHRPVTQLRCCLQNSMLRSRPAASGGRHLTRMNELCLGIIIRQQRPPSLGGHIGVLRIFLPASL